MAAVTIYTTQYCGFCFAAKRLLTELEIDFDEVELDTDLELRSRLSQENGGWRTVPMIFLGDRFIGGYSELSQLNASGELEKFIAPAQEGNASV